MKYKNVTKNILSTNSLTISPFAEVEISDKMKEDYTVLYHIQSKNLVPVGTPEASAAKPEIKKEVKEEVTSAFVDVNAIEQQKKVKEIIEKNFEKEQKEVSMADDFESNPEDKVKDAVEIDSITKAQIIKNIGKHGGVQMPVEEAIAEDLNSLELKEDPEMFDNGEVVSGVSSRTVDFLKQSFSEKKKIISQESDSDFLKEVLSNTKSNSIKSLVKQRLKEIKK